MSSTELAIQLRKKCHRMVRATELDTVAQKLGKVKTKRFENQIMPCYYWKENEVKKVIEML